MFCPRCGTPHEPDVAFCERCGQRLAAESESESESGAAPGGGHRRPSRRVLIVVVAAAAGGGVAGALALTGAFSNGDARSDGLARTTTVGPKVVEPAAAAPAIAESEGPTPTTTTDTVPPPQPVEARSVRATVSRTCGRDGVGGDCHLSVRARPASGAVELERLDEGDPLHLSCQVRGERVHSSALGASSTVWSRTTRGGYVANVYVTGPRVMAQAITLRRC